MKLLLWSLVLFCVFCVGCSSSKNLLPPNFIINDDVRIQAQVLMLKSLQRRDPENHWTHLKYMKIIGKDEWRSQTARLFTPIPQEEQLIQFAFDLVGDGAFLKFLDGDQKGNVIGIENGKTYFVTKGQRQEKESKRVNWYLPPVKKFFLWPQILHKMSNIVDLGEAEHGLRKYDKILATDGEPFKPGADQYIIWINKQTLLIEYIEFILKGRVGPGRGVVQYREYRDVAGVILPHEIILLDNMATSSYSHRFVVQIATLE